MNYISKSVLASIILSIQMTLGICLLMINRSVFDKIIGYLNYIVSGLMIYFLCISYFKKEEELSK